MLQLFEPSAGETGTDLRSHHPAAKPTPKTTRRYTRRRGKGPAQKKGKRAGHKTSHKKDHKTEKPPETSGAAESFKSIVVSSTLRCIENLRRGVTVDEVVQYIKKTREGYEEESIRKRVADCLVFAASTKYTPNPALKNIARGTYDKV